MEGVPWGFEDYGTYGTSRPGLVFHNTVAIG